MSTNNNRLWNWVSGVLCVLLAVSIIGALGTLRQIQKLVTTQVLMGEAVAANAQWIRDWHTVLKVPERDQRQDSDIDELKRRVDTLKREIREN